MAACALPYCEPVAAEFANSSKFHFPDPSPEIEWSDLRACCHDPDFDLGLVARFTELVFEQTCLPCANAFCPAGMTKEACKAIKPILRCLRLLHLARFARDSIEVIMAHTVVYIVESLEKLGKENTESMDMQELASVACLQMFLAHSYVEDKACPLRIWHRHVFAGYCKLRTLNAALLRLMELRGYIMRVDPEVLQSRLGYLREGAFLQLFLTE